MRKTDIWRIAAVLALALGGCQGNDNAKKETQTIADEGDYAAQLPFHASDARQKHTGVLSDQGERFNITSGLMELSKQHFNQNDVVFKESQFLTYDILDASDYSTGLLGRASDKNPDGLNQQREESFDTGDGKQAKGIAPLVDIYELDWYSGSSKLEGISLAMVLTPTPYDAEGKTVSVTKEQLKVFAETQGKKLNSYMRESFPEIDKDLPILITVYCLSEKDAVPGSFIQQAYFTSSSAQFTDINEQWELLPSDDFTKLDGDVATQFNTIKNGLNEFSPDDVYIMGEGRFRDQKLVELNISVNLHAKTGAEAYALTQYLWNQTSLFTGTNYELTIDVMSDNDHVAVMKRSAGSADTALTMLI